MKKLLVLIAVLVLGLSATAGATLIDDGTFSPISYWGAVFSNPSVTDVTGLPFAVDSMDVTMSGKMLTVTLSGAYFTNYLNGSPSQTVSYAPGDLYINPSGWITQDPGDVHHKTDTFTNTENWDFVVKGVGLPRAVGTYSSEVYTVDFNSITMTQAPLGPPPTPTPYAQAWSGGYGNLVTDAQVILGYNQNNVGFMSFVIDDDSSMNLRGPGFHWTMHCGNDVVEGKVPEPSTMLLLGAGLTGLAFFRRRK
jgi:hypothetical protein